MIKYYLEIDGLEEGPFSLDELHEKKISKNTLVWTEGMENWTEAFKLSELQDLVKAIPPPLPPKTNKPVKIETEISEKNEVFISPKTKVSVAKEVKAVFLIVIFGLIIGAVSFTYFYFMDYEVNKYDNYDIKGFHISRKGTVSILDISDFPFQVMSLEYSDVQRDIQRRKEIFTEKSIRGAYTTFLIAFGVLVALRYVTMAAKWVLNTSDRLVPTERK